MCKPAELETHKIVDLVKRMLEELCERCETHQNKVDELLDPINEIQEWIRPFQ